jgi:putative peptidoglycan lipid II flippase
MEYSLCWRMLSAKPEIIASRLRFAAQATWHNTVHQVAIADEPGIELLAWRMNRAPQWRQRTTLGVVSLIKSVSTVSLWTLASRITGLARELLVAAAFGASAMTDAFNVAFRIPNLFRRLFAEGAFSQAFVPVLAASKASEGDDATRQLVDRVCTLLALALLVTCIIGVAAAPLLVWAMASGMQKNPMGFDAAVWMTRFMFPYIAFMSLVALASGVLNTWKRFAVPAATPVLLNMSMIGAAWLLVPWFQAEGVPPIYAMAVGVMVGGLLQLVVQVPALRRIGMLPRLNFSLAAMRQALADTETRKIGRLMLPALLGVSVAQISLLINTQIASHLPTGSVSWLTYADRLMEFPTAMLGVALGVVLMPQLAGASAKKDAPAYSALLDWGLRIVVMLSVPCAVGLLFFSKPIVAVLYHYGAFTAVDVDQTTLALRGWGAGLVGLVAIKVLAPGYYASQDIKTPVRIAMVVLVATQLMNLVLVPYFKHAGLSLSISLGALLNAGWLLVGLLRRGSFRPLDGWGIFVIQIALAAVALVLYLWWAQGLVDWVALRGQAWLRIGWLALLLSGAAGTYFAVLRFAGLNVRQFLKR